MKTRLNCPPQLILYGPLLSLGQVVLAWRIFGFGFRVAQWSEVAISGLLTARQWVAAQLEAVPRASGILGRIFLRPLIRCRNRQARG